MKPKTLIILLVVTAILVLVDDIGVGFNSSNYAKFSEMIYGTAHKPFVCRALIPILTRGVKEIIPHRVEVTLQQSKLMKLLAEKFNISSSYSTELVIVLFWQIFFLYSFFITLFSLVNKIYLIDERNRKLPEIIVGLSVIFLPLFFHSYAHLYDFPQLFLFTAGVYAIYTKNIKTLYLLMPISMLNKETSVLLIIVYVFYGIFNSKPKTKLLLNAFVLLCISAIIKLLLNALFKQNPGPIVMNQLKEYNIPQITRIGALLRTYQRGLGILLLLLILPLEKHLKPKSLFLSTVAIFLIELTSGFLWGRISEFRIFYETFPLLMLSNLPVVAKMLNKPLKPLVK